eukprot:4527613-Pleurochrysis_carterae.AAC.4
MSISRCSFESMFHYLEGRQEACACCVCLRNILQDSEPFRLRSRIRKSKFKECAVCQAHCTKVKELIGTGALPAQLQAEKELMREHVRWWAYITCLLGNVKCVIAI